MKLDKQTKENLFDFLVKAGSLKDLLGILSDICENLELEYLNPKIKHYKYFQFTFFGLMVKTKGTLQTMTYKAEHLRNNICEFEDIHEKLRKLQKNTTKAYDLIHTNRMQEGKNKIIETNKEYACITDISKLSNKLY